MNPTVKLVAMRSIPFEDTFRVAIVLGRFRL
jgi:hypothetical protein